MEWGEHAEFLADIAEEKGETPQALADHKSPDAHLEFYWSAFWALSGDRQLGAFGGAGHIPFLAIDAYGRRYSVADGDEFDRFAALIRAMDAVYLEWLAEQTKKED